VILDLCGGTGGWSKPYSDAGYKVTIIDPLVNGKDIRLLQLMPKDRSVRGVLAAPPCTHLSGSGARWWKDKGEEALLEALSVTDACLRIVLLYKPDWWCLENPVGRLSHFYGKPRMTFQPWEYGDPYTKRTCLWGDFTPPIKDPVEPTEGGKIWKMPPSPDRWIERSKTPPGFAKAFFESNP
jgi:hypothetical protein